MKLLFVLALLPFLSVQQYILDGNCTMPGATPGTRVYAPSAVNCNDFDEAVCAAMYSPSVSVLYTFERAAMCFGTSVTGPVLDNFRAAAIKLCPKTCGYCCLTPQYSCKNPTSSPIDCSQISQLQCKEPSWKSILTKYCPATCGLCPTVCGQGCVDNVSGCAAQASICSSTDPDLLAFANTNCKFTCGLC